LSDVNANTDPASLAQHSNTLYWLPSPPLTQNTIVTNTIY